MDGIERIKILAKEITDKPLLKIIDYLLNRKDMNEKYLNEEKSLKQMISFIKTEAEKESVNGVAMIEDEVVYGWAIHYFDESNEDLKIQRESKKIEKKPITKEKKKVEKNWTPEGQLTLFD